MQQFSVRLTDDHAAALRRLAAERRRSLNQTFDDLVAAATDPAYAGSDVAALRDRLGRAGLTFDVSALADAPGPDEHELERARAAAGRRTPLAELVSEGRR